MKAREFSSFLMYAPRMSSVDFRTACCCTTTISSALPPPSASPPDCDEDVGSSSIPGTVSVAPRGFSGMPTFCRNLSLHCCWSGDGAASTGTEGPASGSGCDGGGAGARPCWANRAARLAAASPLDEHGPAVSISQRGEQ